MCCIYITEISFAETSFYDSGNLSFDYQQSPSGPFSGTYEVEGEIDTTLFGLTPWKEWVLS